jgi:hypothetical protein
MRITHTIVERKLQKRAASAEPNTEVEKLQSLRQIHGENSNSDQGSAREL